MIDAGMIGKIVIANRDGWMLKWRVERVIPAGLVVRLAHEQGVRPLGGGPVQRLSWRRDDVELLAPDEWRPLAGTV